jgi:histidyl-tRNA synthetase
LDRAGVRAEGAAETDYYVLSVGNTRPVAARIVRDLRERGNVVETDLSDRSFGAQMNYADGIDASTVVIVGERDLASGEITIKDMESGEQTTTPVESFPESDRPTHDDLT